MNSIYEIMGYLLFPVLDNEILLFASEQVCKDAYFCGSKKMTMQFFKGTKLYSILTGTCPACHEGDMYVEKNPFKLSKTLKMHDRCSHCNIKFKMEPSFFYGAMYVSYAVGVAIAVATFFIVYFFLGLDRHFTFFAIIGVLAILFPILLRVSRNIWINFFIHYDKNSTETKRG